MVDYCGYGLFHHIAVELPIQIITVGGPGYLGNWNTFSISPARRALTNNSAGHNPCLRWTGSCLFVIIHICFSISVNTEMSVFLWRKQTSIAMPQKERAELFAPALFPQ